MVSISSALTLAQHRGIVRQLLLTLLVALGLSAFPAFATTAHVSEANLVLPDLGDPSLAQFFGSLSGATLLSWSLLVCIGGLLFGAVIYLQVSRLPVHRSMAKVSELIYETCKTYMITQGKFLLILEAFIAVVIVAYFGWVQHMNVTEVLLILAFSLIGIAGSLGVAWFGIRINTLANSRTAFAALRGQAYPVYAIPLKSGISIGMLLISTELLIMLAILLFVPPALAGKCFIGFAIGESLGAAALRIAGGIFTKIADIGSDLMKIVFGIKEDDARNPGVIADCTGDNAGDSVGPTADGFETYGVTGVALISFIMLAIPETAVQVQLLVWIFVMRVMMIIASGISYLVNEALAQRRYSNQPRFDFEAPLTSLVWITSGVSLILTFMVSYLLIGGMTIGGQQYANLWWQLSLIITFGTLAGAVIPEVVKIFTSTKSAHVREVVTASHEGGASLNILAGLTAGNFSAFWMGVVIVGLMSGAYLISQYELAAVINPDPAKAAIMAAVFSFGLVAFGFLGMGPVTIAVDSYGPVTDNAQSVYELSTIEQWSGIETEIQREFSFKPDFEVAKDLLEENDGAGNTFKATAKPVLIGTAVVGAATMVFSIIMLLTGGLTGNLDKLSLLYPPFLLGLISGGATIFWFSGASTQAVSTGAYRAVEFIKGHIQLDGVTKASAEDSKKVVEICTIYAQKGMFNIFMAVFFGTLACAFIEPFFFIGYLISLAIIGLYQAVFMANAGGAWDNAKKIVETELHAKGTELHAAAVVGDTVGDPFKDTSSVAMNPIIKFTTLFGLLAVEMGVGLAAQGQQMLAVNLAALFLIINLVFVFRSFYGMRIHIAMPEKQSTAEDTGAGETVTQSA
ncbi:MAG TPA: sodium-translocating pyrophosphatase [Candidatus Competibacteraceae bacterium]|nr:sodium-translocating pyrophosphatase [Candidatus Competibacteraceae bacterium]MCP5134295.1 sodium-translocating pyrophosphatase [Gammaproteobacteria bacterium]HPF58219.1 sodium-translocating pyrophosphatase [Candidatus Competibacteraceae bacterium]HRY17115.1 sodium-translocating pyrophosphatase [Candidatus Competibacteraceae bacterium]